MFNSRWSVKFLRPKKVARKMKLKNLLVVSLSLLLLVAMATPAMAHPSFYWAEVTVEGTVTLTHNRESYTIPVEATFDTKLPEQIEPGTYEATFNGKVIVSSNKIIFAGTLTFNEHSLKVEFSVENTFPAIIQGTYEASGSLSVTIEKVTGVEITPKVTVKGPLGKDKPTTKAATGILGASPPPPEHRWAVIIGISDYAGTENDIQYADNDALDMVKALTEVYGYDRTHILLLISDYTVNNATRADIINAINWLRDKEVAGDEVVFFYSGHGARGIANDGDKEVIDEAIVPYECTSDALIWDGELKQMFSSFDTSRIIFIFDSCYAGGMTDLKASGRIICMASTESGVAYESGTLQNGVFTYYFVDEGMYQGKADTTPSDGLVTVEEAFDYARANVPTVVSQKPTISDSFDYDLLL
jgi:hypothetical protein